MVYIECLCFVCIILQPSEKLCAQSHPEHFRSQRFSGPEASPWHTLRAAVAAKALVVGSSNWKRGENLEVRKIPPSSPPCFLGCGESGGGKQCVKTPCLQARVFLWHSCFSFIGFLEICFMVMLYHSDVAHITRILRVMFHLRSVHVFCETHLHPTLAGVAGWTVSFTSQQASWRLHEALPLILTMILGCFPNVPTSIHYFHIPTGEDRTGNRLVQGGDAESKIAWSFQPKRHLHWQRGKCK